MEAICGLRWMRHYSKAAKLKAAGQRVEPLSAAHLRQAGDQMTASRNSQVVQAQKQM